MSMSLTDELFSLQLPIRPGHLLAPGQGSRFPGSVERVLERGQADQRRVPGCQGEFSYNPNTLNLRGLHFEVTLALLLGL